MMLIVMFYYSSYPLFIIIEIILNLTFAFISLRAWAGMIIDCPVSNKIDFPSITISAFPSITWMKLSKGETLPANDSPESNETALILPVVLRIIVFITTELGTYSRISTIIKAFDFSISIFSIRASIMVIIILSEV